MIKKSNAHIGAGNGKLSVFENGQFKIFQKNLKKKFFCSKKKSILGAEKNFFSVKIKCPLNCPFQKITKIVFHLHFTSLRGLPPPGRFKSVTGGGLLAPHSLLEKFPF